MFDGRCQATNQMANQQLLAARVTNGVQDQGRKSALTLDTVNPHLRAMKFGIFGPLVNRAHALQDELQRGVKKPFTEVIKANLGDGQAMGQVPITFIREVMALITYPALLEEPRFPQDTKDRARTLLASCAGQSVGAYTEKTGIVMIRQHVAEYIQNRDNIPCDWRDVMLSGGATDIIKSVLKLMIADVDGKKPGVMIPIPQYPLYSASLAEFNMEQIEYYLDEGNNWGLDLTDLQRAIDEAKRHCKPRAIVIINPGNPTGQVLSRDNMQDIIKFAYAEGLFILADEVYQDNVYAKGSQFHSFKKIIHEMGPPYNQMELASFMSCSKGYMGECGLRGGYVEIVNLLPEVKAMYLKTISAMSCSTTIGQAVLDCVVRPPRPGDASHDKFAAEKSGVLASLAERAKLVADTFNSMEGVTCNEVQGAMYAFPQLHLPAGAVEAARSVGQAADSFYAHALLEATGICVVPGSGFGQRPGTYHFRTTILPQPDKLKAMMERFRTFHHSFLKDYQ